MALKNSVLNNADDQKRVGHAFLCWKINVLKFLRYCLKSLKKKICGWTVNYAATIDAFVCQKKGEKVINGLLLCSDV